MQDDLFSAPPAHRFPPPREFQERAHQQLREGLQAGYRRQVLMAPTGAGKTYLALRICNEALARGRRALFVCDRKTLINQTSATADAYGMPAHGIIQADNPRMAMWRPFQIASAQTLAARGANDDYDVIVIDEAHTLYDATTELVKNTKAAVIGLSATPFSKGLGDIYGRVVNAATMHELVGLGVLTPFRVLTCKRPDMRGAKTSGGEWTQGDAGRRGMELVGDVVQEWLTHANNAKTICFGSSVAHCEFIVETFRRLNVNAELFTGQTSDAERETLLADYRRPDSRTRVLVSVEALAKGFDVPDVACVIDARPLRKSLSTFVQMLGRGLRSAPGKKECLLLDHSGNIIRFAEDFQHLYFNGLSELETGERLDREVRRDEDHQPKSCPSCGFTPAGRRCVACGFEPKRRSLHAHETGSMEEYDVLGTGSTALAGSRKELWAQLLSLYQDRAERRVARGGDYGKPDGAAAHCYRRITGDWPKRDWGKTIRVEPSAALRAKVKSLDIAFAKSAPKSSKLH